MVRFLLGAIFGLVAALVLASTFDGVSLHLGEKTVIPPSCRQPPDVDYSGAGPADHGPYAVEVSSFRGVLRRTQSQAMIGPSPQVGTGVSYGEVLELRSTDLDGFSCRWSDEGVTIIEPALDSSGPSADTTRGIEYFVPASTFLGGR